MPRKKKDPEEVPAVDTAVEASAEVPAEKKTRKPRAKKVVDVAEAVIEKAEMKVRKPRAKKTVEAPAAQAAPTAVVETYCEYNGEQISVESLVEQVKAAYAAEGNETPISSVRTYINLAERKAYYVINDVAEEKYIQF